LFVCISVFPLSYTFHKQQAHCLTPTDVAKILTRFSICSSLL